MSYDQCKLSPYLYTIDSHVWTYHCSIASDSEIFITTFNSETS
jgi:hypothetical protein